MKVLYDYQAFFLQKFGGVSNYFVQIIKNLPSDIFFEIAVKECNNLHLEESGLAQIEPATQNAHTFITHSEFKGKSWLYNRYTALFPRYTSLGRNRLMSIEALTNGRYDVFHPTFFSDYFLPYLKGKPYILTIHDMIPELYASEFNRRNEQLVNKAKLINNADHIVAVSKKTKDDLIRFLNIPDDKISVIYHGAPVYNTKAISNPLVNGRYILFVGNRDGYKNFKHMIKELIPVLMNNDDIKIVCTGNPFSPCELKLFEEYHIQDKMIYLHPTDSEMHNLYQNALCFIFPSLYEGFGIPILEAWQADCPVLLNNKSCFPEIAKDAAVFFNLDDQYSDLREVMEKFICMSEEAKCQLMQKQQKRLKDFSWKKSAEQLADIYRMII